MSLNLLAEVRDATVGVAGPAEESTRGMMPGSSMPENNVTGPSLQNVSQAELRARAATPPGLVLNVADPVATTASARQEAPAGQARAEGPGATHSAQMAAASLNQNPALEVAISTFQ
ncbi:hypothetical protein GSI_08757 [Ganoderma sinense ZZ0214-1]|uniref:Uncharacterized protein n=1 Tax=Ganoderma sinense ZZ0214-1 TaxID=1077348 RepID=A0A2G8S4L4_9APHY|nr:hypothetical protein GSI_08757 [Ganoderma sinense ZZ0214-1]